MLFTQKLMRRHLFNCFQNGTLSPFPVERKRVPATAMKETINIHCNCRMPEFSNVDMIECSKCNKWFHNVCINTNIPQVCLDSDVPWYCHSCTV
jgi:hypothetical protein